MPAERMATVDAAWLHMDQPDNRMVITAVMQLDGLVSAVDLERIVSERMVAVYPRFRQRFDLGTLGEARWVTDESFDLRAHIRHLGAPRPGGQQGLQVLVSQSMSRPLDPARPPWEISVVDLWEESPRCALVVRIHHAVADGISLARVLLSLADGAPEEQPASEAPGSPGPFSARLSGRLQSLWRSSESRVASAARLGTSSAVSAGRLLALADDPQTVLRGPLQPQKAVAWGEGADLERVRRIAVGLGGTINDVLLTALAAALGRMLRDHGDDVSEVRTLVPVNLRPLDKPVPRELGNHFGLAFVELPVAHQPPKERFIALKRRMDRLKKSSEPVLTHALLSAVGLTPVQVERLVVDVFGAKASLITTNVPGPREALELGGRRIDQILFWVPQAANVSLGVSLFSYAGRVVWGVSCDRSRIDDPAELVAGIAEALDELEGCLAL